MYHIILGILLLVWGVADVLRLQLPGILGKRLESASAEERRLWQRLLGVLELIVGGGQLLFYFFSDNQTVTSILLAVMILAAVLPLAEAGKREHTGMNHGRKQYGALVLRSREL